MYDISIKYRIFAKNLQVLRQKERNMAKQLVMSALLIVSLLTLVTSCSNDDNPIDEPMLKGIISSYNEFGGAMLDLTEEDMMNAGFTLGDVISLTIEEEEIVMPYYDGYYGNNREFLCVAYPTYPSICFTAINTGLPQEFIGLEGHTITIRMKEKGGSLDVQQAMSMKYSNNRTDYLISDEEFANARAVSAGNIASGVLYRCSSPFCNDINRANYVSEYLEREKVKTILNLADTEMKMLTYDMPPYSRTLWEGGNVILCPLTADPMSDDYNNRLIAALKELPSYPAPYAVNCMEGKDRTGYVCALLEGLCGATYEEMVTDYLISYDNFYCITPENNPDICNTLVSLKLNPCLMYYAGINDEAQLPYIDYAKVFSNYLLSHGMNRQQLDALVQVIKKTDNE